jgi:hypothetical protein
MTSVRHHKQVKGTSMEKLAKARALEARPSMNFLQPKKLLSGF